MEKCKILLVEDDRDINGLIAYNLRNDGFLVEQVFDGIDALKRVNEEYFSIVILDIMLPGVSGLDVLRHIKSSVMAARSYVVIISAKSSQQDKLYAHILGADCYIGKPFLVKELISVAREISSFCDREYTVNA